jgi:hypothetical protein
MGRYGCPFYLRPPTRPFRATNHTSRTSQGRRAVSSVCLGHLILSHSISPHFSYHKLYGAAVRLRRCASAIYSYTIQSHPTFLITNFMGPPCGFVGEPRPSNLIRFNLTPLFLSQTSLCRRAVSSVSIGHLILSHSISSHYSYHELHGAAVRFRR